MGLEMEDEDKEDGDATDGLEIISFHLEAVSSH